MFNGIFNNLSEGDKNDAVESIIQHASPRHDFFLMLFLSVSMAAFGILLDSTIILVGSMLIAPLLFPLFSFTLGIIMVDEKLIRRSSITIIKSVTFALLASFMIGALFAARESSTTPLLITTIGSAPSLIYAIVAAISGFAGAFAMAKPHLNASLPGVAVSVSLVPPLATAGIALSLFNVTAFTNALLIFLVNVIGITFSGLIVFSLLQFSKKKAVASEVIKEEDKIIKHEVKKTS